MRTIWINDDEKIASFKCVDGFEAKMFELDTEYELFLLLLINNGYRFQ